MCSCVHVVMHSTLIREHVNTVAQFFMCNCSKSTITYSTTEDNRRKGSVKVKLTGEKPLVLNGSITGRMYIFRNMNDINWVDRRDALEMKDHSSLTILY